jgi:hypothetical protein
MKRPIDWIKLSAGIVTCEHCGVKKPLTEIGMWKNFLELHRYCRMPTKVKGAK